MAWTKEQTEAIQSRGANLLLSAAAGSGKTAVLVERIVGRLLDEKNPIDINQLLVMTFTRAAAGEMRSRVGAALAAAEAKDPSPRIERQLALLGSAQISTIHAFCTGLIRKYFYRLDLDPTYRQAQPTETALLQVKVLDEVLAEFYEEGHPDFLRLTDAFRRRSGDDPLRTYILQMYEYSRSLPFPEDWLDHLADTYGEISGTAADLQTTEWKWNLDFSPFPELLRDMQSILSRDMSNSNIVKAVEVLAQDAALAEALVTCSGWSERYALLQGHAFARWPGGKIADEAQKQLKDEAKSVRESFKEMVNSWRDGFLAIDPGQWQADMVEARNDVQMLVRLTKAFSAQFAQAKRDARMIDFSDLEHLTLSLLLDPSSTPQCPMPSETAREIAAEYAEVMVDEYQDTNGVQELIAALVSRADNRFMVGDVKQSIYRFRMADPTIFLEKYESYESSPEALHRRIDLARNFRSHENILAATNYVFRQIMRKPYAEMDYGDREALYPGRLVENPPQEWVGGNVDVRLLYKEEEEEAIDDDVTAARAQAAAIAKEILRLKESGQRVQQKDGRFTPLAWRDIVVLARSLKADADVFVEEFRRAGIPVFAEQAGGYFQAIEVQVMMALLAIVDNSRRDLAVAAVLRSPLVGWNERDLAHLRLLVRKDETKSFFEIIPQWLEQGYGEARVQERTRRFLLWYRSWHEEAARVPVATLLRKIYENTGYIAYVSGLPGGKVRAANLEALYRRAVEFDENLGGGLPPFLAFFEQLKDEGTDLGIPSVIGEGEDVVRLMTIHKSKGLEFPVVFLANTEKKFNQRDFTQPILLHREMGIGIQLYQAESEMRYPTLPYLLLRQRLQMEMKAEEQRMLYVAMTRARDKLYIYGYLRNKENQLKERAGDREGGQAKSYLDWILSALAQHHDTAAHWEETVAPCPNQEGRWSLQLLPVEPAEPEREWEPVEKDHFMRAVYQGEKTGEFLPAKLAERLSWNYSHGAATELPAKVTVTEVTHRPGELRIGYDLPEFVEGSSQREPLPEGDSWREPRLLAKTEEDEVERPPAMTSLQKAPAFLLADEANAFGGLQYGTLIHRMMEHIDWRDMTEDGLRAQLEAAVRDGYITAEERKMISVQRLWQWAQSDACQRLCRAEFALQECPFSILIPAGQVFDVPLDDEKVFLQGVIDCVFSEDDGLAILDFKTDRVTDLQVLQERYQRQLELYAYAAQRIWQKPIKRKIIYSWHLGQEISWQ